MKTVGIIGGIAPESTVEYYRLLIAEYRARVPDGSYPPLFINSIDLTKMIGLIESGLLDATADYLAGEVVKLARAGADFAAMASNTPHIVFDEIRRRSPIPVISIVEAACEAALALGVERVGLFGTRFTMQGAFYPQVFNARGIAVVVPEPEDLAYLHEKYFGELVKGLFLPETRERVLGIAESLRERQRVQAVVLGGTELPLLLRDTPASGVAFLDTTAIHVRRIVEEMLSGA